MEAHTSGGHVARPTGPTRRLATETKQAFKTTEFWVYVTLLISILIAGTVDNSEGSQFGADDVWLYATILTGAYLLSRGFAKSGSRDPYWGTPESSENGEALGDRVKAAAQVLTEGQQGGTNEQTGTVRR